MQLHAVFRIVRHGHSSEDIDAQQSKVENHGEEKHRSETSITKFLTPEMRGLRQVQWSRIERDCGVEGGKEKKYPRQKKVTMVRFSDNRADVI